MSAGGGSELDHEVGWGQEGEACTACGGRPSAAGAETWEERLKETAGGAGRQARPERQCFAGTERLLKEDWYRREAAGEAHVRPASAAPGSGRRSRQASASAPVGSPCSGPGGSSCHRSCSAAGAALVLRLPPEWCSGTTPGRVGAVMLLHLAGVETEVVSVGDLPKSDCKSPTMHAGIWGPF